MAVGFSPLRIFAFIIFDFFLGFMWYSPRLFAKPWMKAVNITEEQIKQRMAKDQNMGKLFATQICFNIITILVHTYFMVNFNPSSLIDSLTMSLLLWVGFVAGPYFAPILWEAKSINYFLINAGQKFVSMMTFSLFYYSLGN
jgi:hypothetical protein